MERSLHGDRSFLLQCVKRWQSANTIRKNNGEFIWQKQECGVRIQATLTVLKAIKRSADGSIRTYRSWRAKSGRAMQKRENIKIASTDTLFAFLL
jgi:hypothetical protein